MTKHRLDMEPDPEVMLIGISCHVNDYRLCWALNRSLGISLTRREKDIHDPGPERMAHYSVFDHTDEESEASFKLVNNHSGDGILVKEHKQVDYFLVVDESAPITPEELIDHVRKTDFVLTAYALNARTERGAHKLLQ